MDTCLIWKQFWIFQLYVLYEHATGYALFLVKEVEEIGALLPTVERAITECSLFKSVVKLVAFSPYKSGTNALDNVNSLSEGMSQWNSTIKSCCLICYCSPGILLPQ